MRILPFILMLAVLFGCNERKQTENPQDAEVQEADSLGLTSDMQEKIVALSDLDCQLLKLYATPYDKKGEAALVEEIVRVQEERSNVLAGLLKNKSDSLLFNTIQTELKRLSETEDYCAGTAQDSKPNQGNMQEGTATGEKNIKEDAASLARLNCRLMEAHKALEAMPGDAQATRKVSALRHEKQLFFRSLTLKYGVRVIHDPFFRKLVFEAQEQQCQYNSEMKAAGRVPQGTL